MATSDKQIRANQKNGKLGGVKTPEGKAISKLNATKHGLLSKEILLTGESESDLIKLGKEMRANLNPIGELEIVLTDRVVSSVWRLKRALRVEKNIMSWYKEKTLNKERVFDKSSEAQIERESVKDMLTNNDIERLIKYETTISRGLDKALYQLVALQNARVKKSSLPLTD